MTTVPFLRPAVSRRTLRSLRRGNILMEFIASYGLQAVLIAGSVALAIVAYNMVTSSGLVNDVRLVHGAIRATFGMSGRYAINTNLAIGRDEFKSFVYETAASGGGTTKSLRIASETVDIKLFDAATADGTGTGLAGANPHRYFALVIGDGTTGLSAGQCAEIMSLRLPGIIAIQAATVGDVTIQNSPSSVTTDYLIGAKHLEKGSGAGKVTAHFSDVADADIATACDAAADTTDDKASIIILSA